MQPAKLHKIRRVTLVCSEIAGPDRRSAHTRMALLHKRLMKHRHHTLTRQTVLVQQQHGIGTLSQCPAQTLVMRPAKTPVFAGPGKLGEGKLGNQLRNIRCISRAVVNHQQCIDLTGKPGELGLKRLQVGFVGCDHGGHSATSVLGVIHNAQD